MKEPSHPIYIKSTQNINVYNYSYRILIYETKLMDLFIGKRSARVILDLGNGDVVKMHGKHRTIIK